MSLQAIDLPYLIPDLPTADEVLPYLYEIDKNRWYSNYGPLEQRLLAEIQNIHFSRDNANILLCSNGTAALELGLLSLGLKPGARVLVPAFTFPASANAIENVGLEPVFCDVHEESWVLTPDIALEAIAQARIDAVMPVAALGRPLPARSWDEFVTQTGVPVLIDAAPALGSQRVGKNFLVAYSMHATKAFGIGEGGVLACADQDVISLARRISNFGMDARGQVVVKGNNYKLSEYHAAVGLAQAKRWPSQQLKRARIASSYQSQLSARADLWAQQRYSDSAQDGDVLVRLPGHHIRSTLPVRLNTLPVQGIGVVQELMAQAGIGTRLWYNPGLHRHPRWVKSRYVPRLGARALSVVDWLNHSLIGLPFHNFLSATDIDRVVATLGNIVESREFSASIS